MTGRSSLSSRTLFGLTLLSTLVQGGCGSSQCKAFPGSRDWPSNAKWQQLNHKLGGRLLTPPPPGGVCHEGQPNYDESQCPAVQEGWTSYDWHAANPVSMMNDQFANWTCLPDPALPCSDEGYPPYVINATTPEHVKAGIDFARENNVRLIVKSSGHDYLGRSNAPGSLSIWTHHINEITYHEGQFTLAGCGKVIKGNALTMGGGTQVYDMYRAADEHGQAAVGGGGKSVSMGGFLTGGGHSILSSTHGLGVDQILEMQVVTPAGKILTINEEEYPDLFWAMRGAGSSTFGVMTSVTVKTFPTPKVTKVLWAATTDPELGPVDDLIRYMMTQVPYLMDSGISGYSLASRSYPTPFSAPGIPPLLAGFFGASIIQDKTLDEVMAVFKPINDTINERWPGAATVFALPQEFDTFLDWYEDNYDMTFAGNSTFIVSRVIPGDVLENNPDELAEAMQPALSTYGLPCYMVGGKGVQNAKPRGGSNSVNPGWRKAYLHSPWSLSFPPFNLTAERETIDFLDTGFQKLRDLTPGMGAYINEALPYEDDYQHVFWGDNYERLLKIKRSVDPNDVFWCQPCVGNEGWEEHEDGMLCKK